MHPSVEQLLQQPEGKTLEFNRRETNKPDRVVVGKPAPGKFITPVEVWVTPKTLG